MREFITNFQKKHGHQVPMPKIYGDEDSSDSEGLELADGTRVAKKTTGGACGGDGPSTSSGGVGRSRGKKRGRTMMAIKMTLTNAGRQGAKMHHQNQLWPAKSHARRPQFTPRLTETCQYSTSLARKREPCWVTACWTGLMSRRGRYMR